MKLTNAIKKVEKIGQVIQSGQRFSVQKGNEVLEFLANGKIEKDTNITCIRVRRIKDQDDAMSDYCAGVWCDNISQAIRLLNK